MSLVITTSPNISIFDFTIETDLSTNQINIDDNSTYIGGGAALVQGIDFTITSPLGTTVWTNSSYAPPDILPSAPVTFTKNLPTFNGQLEFGQFVVTGVIKDQSGVLYSLTKSYIVCKPNQDELGNYGVANVIYRVDCKNAKIIVSDSSTYIYNSLQAVSVSRTTTVYPPPQYSLSPIVMTAQYFNVTPMYIGEYTLNFVSTATYNLGNGVTVVVPYKYLVNFPVQCDINLCDAYCALETIDAQYRNLANLNPTQAKDLQNTIQSANTQIELINIGIACAFDVSNHVNILNELLNVKCNCSCGGQVPQQPTSICCDKDIAMEAGCGDMSVTSSTVGNLTTWTFNDKSYVVQALAGQTGISVAVTTSGCTKTYSLSICPDELKMCEDYTICSLNSSVTAPNRPTIQNVSIVGGTNVLEDVIDAINSDLCQTNVYLQYFYDCNVAPAWINITLLNSWYNQGGTQQTAQYRKWTSGVNTGLVEIRGTILKDVWNGAISTVFTLPAAIIPTLVQTFDMTIKRGTDPFYAGFKVADLTNFTVLGTGIAGVQITTLTIDCSYYTT